jgi:cystathionine gamma-synthase
LGYWQDSGIGISSRLADFLYPQIDHGLEIKPFEISSVGNRQFLIPEPTWVPETLFHLQLKQKIVLLLERAPALLSGRTSLSKLNLSPKDVYLFPTGMAALYRFHTCLSVAEGNKNKSVAFGMLFQSTLHILQEYGAGMKLFPRGNEPDLEELETFCKSEYEAGRKLQAVYVEFSSNPGLVSSDLVGLRALADVYDFVLVVDETIGSFANIDVLSVADVIITSLTKSFSGYADVMGGSLVLNPHRTTTHHRLKSLLESNFHNELFSEDASVLEHNSQNYLERSTILNKNAQAVANFLKTKAIDPGSSVSQVNYPSVSETERNFRSFMRQKTPEFTPGYGCLLSVEFEEIENTIAFYDALQCHCGPHLGAHLSLALPYNKAMFGRTPEDEAKAEANGWTMRQIRLSVGLEDTTALVNTVGQAVLVADAAKKSHAH